MLIFDPYVVPSWGRSAGQGSGFDFALLNTVYNSMRWSESVNLSSAGYLCLIVVVTHELCCTQQYEIGDVCQYLTSQYCQNQIILR